MRRNMIVKREQRQTSTGRIPRRVLIVTDLTRQAGRDIFYGISRFTRQRPEWSIMLFNNAQGLTARHFADFEQQRYDGILLATSGTANEELARSVLKSNMPVVCIGAPGVIAGRRFQAAFLRLDNLAVGATGAKYLLSLGNWRTLGYVPLFDTNMYWSQMRLQGFLEESRARGHAHDVFEASFADSAEDASALKEWLSALPKPCAIMAASDARAIEVVSACRECGISIPDQVAILGVDNDVSLCDFSRPSLSSILPDHEGIGFAAARELARLMNGKDDTPARTIKPIRNMQIIERETTATATPAAHLIVRALDYIRRNSSHDIKVEDVVRHLGVSRRLADLRFKEFHSKTILETITECRLDEVCNKLASTNQKIDAISRECGFRNVTYLKTLFRRNFGMTMREWRKKQAIPYDA